MSRKLLAKLFLSAAVISGLSLQAQTAPPVRAWEGTLELPTYQEGAPDQNPPFDVYATNSFNYPYTLRTELTGEKKLTRWRALFLENEYLRCAVLPDIGGHLYSCTDKLNGQPMFYDNSAIKKAKIGYRGAWAAFGIEFNFPVSHNWVSMSPVDFSVEQSRDGSASVHVGNTDRAYGMHWEVALILRPGQTVLEEDVKLENLSDVRHRYYWWNNAALRVWDDSRIDYPMKYTAAHHFADIAPWPMTPEGRDQSIIGQQTTGAVSRFIYGSREPYMGVWHPHTNSGVAHYADFSTLPGKKIWSWGADRDGRAWRTALSDDESAYVEVQAGLYRNQETFAFLEPAETLHFHEFWMPVRGTGGITRANLAGVLHLQRDDNGVHAALNVNRAFPHARIELEAHGKSLWKGEENLTPAMTWRHDLTMVAKDSPVRFVLRSESGEVLLEQTEGVYDWDPDNKVPVGKQPRWDAPAPAQRTEKDWLRAGEEMELLGQAQLALANYEDARKRLSSSMSLKLATARVLVGLSRYREALPLLEVCAAADPANGKTAYLLGLAREETQHERGALAAYEVAYRQADSKAAAALRLGELHARLGDADPRPYFREATTASPDDQRAAEEAAIAGNVSGPDATALLQQFPLSAVLQELAGKALNSRLAADPYLTLQTAATFMRLARWQEALNILSRQYPDVPEQQREPGYVLPQKHPLVLYAAAYCADRLGQDPAPYLARAKPASIQWVFPSMPVEETALRFALSRDVTNAQADALLGTLLFSRGLVDEGVSSWTRALLLDRRTPVAGVQLAKAQMELLHDPSGALDTLRNAVMSDPQNAEVYPMLVQAMSIGNTSAAERVRALERYPNDPAKMPAPVVYQLALARAEAGNFDGAEQLFHDRFFARAEREGLTPEQVAFEVALMRAEAASAEGKCAFERLAGNANGIPSSSKAQTYARFAEMAEKCGHHSDAIAFWMQAAKMTDLPDLPWAARAAKYLPGYDATRWRSLLQDGLAEATRRIETHPDSLLQLYLAELYGELGKGAERTQALHYVFLLPDNQMSHHSARLLLAR